MPSPRFAGLRQTLNSEYTIVMERNLKEVFHEAAQLPERDRATLAGLLIETLDPVSEPDVEAAWSEEIRRRVAEIDAGTVELIPWEEVRAELFSQSNES
jgi:putative addiction module component (TIGR02574 family)